MPVEKIQFSDISLMFLIKAVIFSYYENKEKIQFKKLQ